MGKEFRKEYGHLGEMRGLLNTSVNIMALTATTTKHTRKNVCKSLSLLNPIMILRSPEKCNIVYKVSLKVADIEEKFASLAEVRKKRRNTVIFCRKYDDTSHIYLYLKSVLDKEMMDPIGYPDVSQFRLIDMFTACTTPDVKESIVKSFTQLDGKLRIIIATVAFGMGMDCPNVRRIIHWGPPSDVESYIQETGRADRDGEIAHAWLYYSSKELSQGNVKNYMITYCHSKSECRRFTLFKEFNTYDGNKPIGCMCCDICAATCCCGLC